MLSSLKKFALVGLLAVAVLLPSYASAHVLQSDRSIGAVMHVDPDDDPEAGKPATFFFDIKDKTNRFTLSACDCSVQVLQNGSELTKNALGSASSGLTVPAFSFTFPVRGIYSLRVHGSPKTPGAFDEFTLTYPIRVDRGGTTSAAAVESPGHLVHYIIFGGAFAFLLAFELLSRRGKKPNGRPGALGLLAVVTLSGFMLHEMCTGAHMQGQQASGHVHECCSPKPIVLVDTSVAVVGESVIPVLADVLAPQTVVDPEPGTSRAPPLSRVYKPLG